MRSDRFLLAKLVLVSCLVGVLLGTALIALQGPQPSPEPATVTTSPAARPTPPAARPLALARAVPDERMDPIPPPSAHPSGPASAALGLAAGPTVSADGTLRAIALVEPNFRAIHPEWQAVVERRFAVAAELLHAAAGIRLSLAAAPLAWEPSGNWSGLDGLLEVLERDSVPSLRGGHATLAVGIAAQVGELSTGTMCGIARDLRNTCIVLDLMGAAEPEALGQVTLAHEIAHCLGCFHVPAETSIMVPQVGGRVPDHFDDANREVLRLTRGFDVSMGERGLPEPTLRRIAELARAFGCPGSHNPGAAALEERSYRMMVEERDNSEAARLARAALEFEPGRLYARYNLAVALARLNQPHEAQRELERVIEDNPTFGYRLEVRRLREALSRGAGR